MTDEILPADFKRLTTYPLAERANKISIEAFARAVDPAGSLTDFLAGLRNFTRPTRFTDRWRG